MEIASRGATRAVDWEQRIDFERLRRDRFERAKASLQKSDLGALLLFDPNNIRYVTSTHIGEWARDRNARFAFLPRDGAPILWDFGSAAKNYQLKGIYVRGADFTEAPSNDLAPLTSSDAVANGRVGVEAARSPISS
jgi:Creatinase/Prolidase N-terminal domain